MASIRSSAGIVMSTIPTTSSSTRVPYTIVGGKREDRSLQISPPLSILLLHRGSRPYRQEYFRELQQLGNIEILSIESKTKTYDVDLLSRKHPTIRFLILREEVSRGEQINIGMKEASGQYVFVMWSDMKVSSPLNPELLRRFVEAERLCTVPVIQNTKLETVPSVMVPAFHRRSLKLLPMLPQQNGMHTLFPFDYCGVYQKEKFLLTGGYDYSIPTPHWQKMDFGFRAHMWGYNQECETAFRIRYLATEPTEDTTPDKSYKQFFLKNLTIRFSGDRGEIPWRRFLSYYVRSGSSFFTAVKEFKKVREWAALNQYRFKMDAWDVTELWEGPEA